MLGAIGEKLLICVGATMIREQLDKHVSYNSIESKLLDSVWLSVIVYSGFTIAYTVLEEITNK